MATTAMQKRLSGKVVRVSEGSGPGSNKTFTVCDLNERAEYLVRLEYEERDYYSMNLLRERGWIAVKDDKGRFDCFPINRLTVV